MGPAQNLAAVGASWTSPLANVSLRPLCEMGWGTLTHLGDPEGRRELLLILDSLLPEVGTAVIIINGMAGRIPNLESQPLCLNIGTATCVTSNMLLHLGFVPVKLV